MSCRWNRCSCVSNCVWLLGVMIVDLVGVEVRRSDIDVEQVVAAGGLGGAGVRQGGGAGPPGWGGPGSGSARARVSRMLVMYSALKAWKARPSEMARAMSSVG